MKAFVALLGALGLFLVVQTVDPLGFEDVMYWFRVLGIVLIGIFLEALLEKDET